MPQQHLVDLGYTSAQLIANSQKEYGIDLFGPVALNAKWQAKEGLGFDLYRGKVRRVKILGQNERAITAEVTLDIRDRK